MKSPHHRNASPAVVVGLCAHGLAVARALARNQVEVHALEAVRALPGCATRVATVHHVEEVNGPGVVGALQALREQLSHIDNPVLFLTNDNMVREVAIGWERLAGGYRLSWSDCRETVLALLDKAHLEGFYRAAGLHYPRSVVVRNEADLSALADWPHKPLIVKPSRPMSAFKVKLVESLDEIGLLMRVYRADLPFVVQQFVGGDDTRLSFSSLYLSRGEPVARFDTHKLRSTPPAQGMATVAEPRIDEEVYQLVLRLSRKLRLSGPLSQEFKRDETGRLWAIEPTVGRTEFCVDCATANGVNLPYVEYCDQAGLPTPRTSQLARRVWINTERDPPALFWYVGRCLSKRSWLRAIRFPYLDAEDPRPWLAALSRWIGRFIERLRRVTSSKLLNRLSRV
jgi:D-aspartate ligase